MQNQAIPDFLAELFSNGTLKVDSKGRVWRYKTLKAGRLPKSGVKGPAKDIEPRRIDRETDIGCGRRILIRRAGKSVSIGIWRIKRYFGIEENDE